MDAKSDPARSPPRGTKIYLEHLSAEPRDRGANPKEESAINKTADTNPTDETWTFDQCNNGDIYFHGPYGEVDVTFACAEFDDEEGTGDPRRCPEPVAEAFAPGFRAWCPPQMAEAVAKSFEDLAAKLRAYAASAPKVTQQAARA